MPYHPYQASFEAMSASPHGFQDSIHEAVLRLTPMVGGLAQLLGSKMEEEFEPTLVWLQGKLKLDDAGLSKLFEKYPSFLGLSPESHKERVAWLQKRLDMDDQSLSKLVKTLPHVLGYSIDDNLEPKLAWLKARLKLDDRGISKLAKTTPKVFSYSIDDNLEPKLAWLKARLELDDRSISKLVKRLAHVFSYSIDDNLEPKLSWLQLRLSLGNKRLSLVAQRMPQLLCCNIETNLEPTMKFYEDCVGSDAMTAMIATSPSLITFSLEKRLKPRLAVCQEAGIPIDTATVKRIAKYTEDDWSSGMAFQKRKLLKQQQL
jgi:hypothetical protein